MDIVSTHDDWHQKVQRAAKMVVRSNELGGGLDGLYLMDLLRVLAGEEARERPIAVTEDESGGG